MKPFDEQTDYEKLNGILEYLNENKSHPVLLNDILGKMLNNVTNLDNQDKERKVEIKLALNHLSQTDKYIDVIGLDYKINFSGRMFIKDGGYTSRACRNKRDTIIKYFYFFVIAVGTSAAGAYGVFEIWLYFHCPCK